jgi:hypothetical protein
LEERTDHARTGPGRIAQPCKEQTAAIVYLHYHAARSRRMPWN